MRYKVTSSPIGCGNWYQHRQSFNSLQEAQQAFLIESSISNETAQLVDNDTQLVLRQYDFGG